MKTNKLLIILILNILNLLSFNDPLSAQSIVGKWLFAKGTETVEFAEEGVFRVLIDKDGYSYGIFEFDKDILTFAFFDMEQTFSYAVIKVDEKQLILFNSETNDQLNYSYLGKHEIPHDEIETMVNLINSTDDVDEFEEDYYMIADQEESTDKGPVWELTEENTKSKNTEKEEIQVKMEEAESPVPIKQSSSHHPNSKIAGNWYCSENNITMTLTDDHYFVKSILADELVRDIYPDPEVSYGKYKFDGNKLTLLTFNTWLSSEEEIPVENLNTSGFMVPIDFYGEKTYQKWVKNGASQLSQNDKSMLVSWTNYLKFAGQWLTKDEQLKFMGDGVLFAGKPGSSGAMLLYGVTDDTLLVSQLGAKKDVYIYKGKIMEFTNDKLVLKDLKDEINYTYTAEGKPKLTEEEIAIYSRYLQMQHRTTMDIIDIMDGVKDWKWVEKRY